MMVISSNFEYRVVVQGQGPGPRYGHVMDLVAQRYLVTVSGNDGNNSCYSLNLFLKTCKWKHIAVFSLGISWCIFFLFY